MKNQYVGDIGDYGKYSLLKAFADSGVRVGVNWYLTEDDGSTDGKFNDYLKTDKYRCYDSETFDGLKAIVYPDCENLNSDRSVLDIENSGLIPRALYYSDVLGCKSSPNERSAARSLWFQESLHILHNADLVFMDPDNGLLVSNNPRLKNSNKYALPSEVNDVYRSGRNVVYYCHKVRRKESAWKVYLRYMLQDELLPDAMPIVLTFHKGTQRSYVFLIHNGDYRRYKRIISEFTNCWGGVFEDQTSFVHINVI